MTNATDDARLTFGEAVKDFGWFSLLFTSVIGGVSVLALLESVFVDHKLGGLFQWIVDGYARIAALAGAMVEPLFRPALDWLNVALHWDLHLAPHWRPLVILGMVIVLGLARAAWRSGEHKDAILAFVVIGAGALVGALISGVLPMQGGWWAQGVAGAAPTFALFTFFAGAAALSDGGPEDATPVRAAVIVIFAMTAIAFVLGAGLSFAPGLREGAGVVALALMVGLFGLGFLWFGLAKNDRGDAALGLTVLGGFATAALVLIADLAVKALGS